MPTCFYRSRSRLGAAVAFGALGLLLGFPVASFAQPQIPIELPDPEPEVDSELELPTPKPLKETPKVDGMTVRDCIGVALHHQPSLKAVRASLASSETSYRALCNTTGLTAWFAPDLEVRKLQALKSIEANKAELAQTEWDTVYSVTRTYYTVVYARQQLTAAEYVAAELKAKRDTIKLLVETGATRNLNETSVYQIDIYLSLVQQKAEMAKAGDARALAALREAMGVKPTYPIRIPEQRLPEFDLSVTQEYVVSAALARRGELALAQIAGEVFDLEAFAQASFRRQRSYRTVGMGGDLHVRQIPQRNFGQEYRPGGIAVEMPPSVYGTTEERVEKVKHLGERARAVYQKTCNLLTLEASDAFIRWEQASDQIARGREGYDSAIKMLKFAKGTFFEADAENLPDVALSNVLVGQALSAYNESLYQGVLALADLERVTAGGVRINWPAPQPPLELPKNGTNGNGEKP